MKVKQRIHARGIVDNEYVYSLQGEVLTAKTQRNEGLATVLTMERGWMMTKLFYSTGVDRII